jgi:hypothetical protein
MRSARSAHGGGSRIMMSCKHVTPSKVDGECS